MNRPIKQIKCPKCKGTGIIERKGYYSDCPASWRHLYTTKSGLRINHCVYCGKKRVSRLKDEQID